MSKIGKIALGSSTLLSLVEQEKTMRDKLKFTFNNPFVTTATSKNQRQKRKLKAQTR